MKILAAWSAVAALLTSQGATAQGFFLPASDTRLRDDLSLLVDEGVVNLPVNEWPLAREDVLQAVARVDVGDLEAPALRAAWSRVMAATAPPLDATEWRIREVSATAGQPGLLRDDATAGRENFELRSVVGMGTDRYSITLAAIGVLDPSDGQDVRFDGSDVTVRWGNWLLSANQMDRWWGPGRDGSLILSTNARPMPALSLDRYRTLPVEFPVLRWLGPWRFSGFMGLMENSRPDIDRPVFMSMRVSFKPLQGVEFGMSRTAQFCGKGRICGAKTLGRVLIGLDNPGYRGLDDPNAEPGNQMAGFDVRLASPFKEFPLAVYSQLIGEDNSHSGPMRFLGQFGVESWLMLDSASVLRAHIEYANTKVRWYKADLEPDVAYRQHIFFAGYRYRSRNIGHTTDADSETSSMGLSLTRPGGHRWSLLYRHGRLDSYGTPDVYNAVTFGPSDYDAVQLSWEGRMMGQGIGAQLGYEKQSPSSAGDAKGAFGFIQWRKAL